MDAPSARNPSLLTADPRAAGLESFIPHADGEQGTLTDARRQRFGDQECERQPVCGTRALRQPRAPRRSSQPCPRTSQPSLPNRGDSSSCHGQAVRDARNASRWWVRNTALTLAAVFDRVQRERTGSSLRTTRLGIAGEPVSWVTPAPAAARSVDRLAAQARPCGHGTPAPDLGRGSPGGRIDHRDSDLLRQLPQLG